MFERFTDRARRVVVLAQEEARMLDHNYIGTEHLLLGLIHEGGGVAFKALETLGISLAEIRGDVEEIIGRGQIAPAGHIPFTPRAKKVLELSLREALQLGHSYIGTEHILLGLIHEGEGVAFKALETLGISLAEVRGDVEEIIGRGQALPPGHIPFTPRAKKVLELSLREALQLGHNYIGTEHILLGLVREGEGVAAQVLQKRGADLNRVRQAVVEQLSGSVGEPLPQPHGASREMSELMSEVSEGSEVQPTSPETSSKDFPVCPSCLSPLAETAAIASVPGRKEDDTVLQVELLYCSRCGWAVGTIP